MFTKEQIIKGLKLAQGWYEGRIFDDLDPDQILEAITFAV